MELQDIFTKVKNHLLQQKVRSVHAVDNTCLYRGPNGNRCAIGALIPDALYTTDIEGYPVKSIHVYSTNIELIKKVSDFLNLDDPLTLDFLDSLQRIHDEVKPENWESELRLVAKDYGLQYDELAPTVEELNKTLPAKETQPCT